MKHIVSFSGGKDSTAMLLMMLERKMLIDEIIFCDTGVEFPQMYDHIKKVEKHINRKVTIVKAEHDYFYYLTEYEISKGKRKGEKGYGYPDFKIRWCTSTLKKEPFKKYLKKYNKNEVIEYHGIAKDEEHRTKKNNEGGRIINYPLVEWGITENEALQYCYGKGFDFGGLYEKFARVSCWCCPLARIEELRILYSDYPELWGKMISTDNKTYRDFRADYTINELDRRFKREKGLFG